MVKVDREAVAKAEFYSIHENHFIKPWEEQTEKIRQKYFKKADAFIRQWKHLAEDQSTKT